MMKNLMVIMLGAVSVVGVLTSCSQAKPDENSHQSSIGMANPASVYCLSLKGRLESIKGPNGESSDCILPSGERIDEWALYRRDHS